ncbi:MAG: exodeoxyribonuclease VII large subunit, partial [Myxococcales bacterium]
MGQAEIQHAVYTVSQLTREIKFLLEHGFAFIRVEGEITDMTVARSGHWYFSLKDEDARLSAVMFRGQNRLLVAPPKDGAQVEARGRLNVYEPRGQYQLVVDSLVETGRGKLLAAFEALKKKLAAEGLFDEDKKRPLPFLPRRIALVTSPEGAAVRDMIRVIARRNPAVSLVVVPTLVQGEAAPREIVAAIRRAGALRDVELVIVGRGGGSMEDLWAFNDEEVARAIRSCPTPVVSAVGHEVDFTIADFAADLRAPTPSAAGELAVPLYSDLTAALQRQGARLG